jgi:tape measure domain-containing protein
MATLNKDISLTLAFRTLGIRDVKAVTGDLKAVKGALDEIKRSGAGPDEIARATAAAEKQTAALRRELERTPGAVTALASAMSSLKIRSVADIRADIAAVNAELVRVKQNATSPLDIARATAAAEKQVASLRRELGLAPKSIADVSSAFARLNVRTFKDIRADIEATNAALERVRRSGAAPDELARATASAQQRVARLTAELQGAVVRTRDLGTASAGISNAYRTLNARGPAELRREIMGVESALNRIKASAAGTTEIARVSAIARQRVAELRAELNGVAVAGANAGGSVTPQLAGVVSAAVAARAAVSEVQSVLAKGLAVESLQVQFDFAFSGDVSKAGEELAFVRALVEELGLELESTARSYAKLAAASRGTALEGEATRDIFRAVASAATVMRLSTEQTEGALLAIQQMISKGNVQAEELRGQLGERLPGAFQIAARAIGVTTQELDGMLKKGEVIAADFLPKFAAELQRSVGGSLETASDSLGAQLNRITNRLTEFQQRIAASGVMDTVALQIENLLARIEAAADSGELDAFAKKIADVMSGAINIVAAVTDAAIALARALELLAPVIAGLAVVKAAGALGLLNGSLVGMATAAGAAGTAAQVATAAARGFLSVFTKGVGFAAVGLAAEQVLKLVAAMREYSDVTTKTENDDQKFVADQNKIIKASAFAKDVVRLNSEQINQLSVAERTAYEERLTAAADYYRAKSNLETFAARHSNVTPQAAIDAGRESRAYETSLSELNYVLNRRVEMIQEFNARQAQAKDQVLATLKQKLGEQLKAYDNANKALENARKRRESLAKANDEFIAGIGQKKKPDREVNTGDVQDQISKSRKAVSAGDFEGAIKAGERAKELISEIDRAGGSSADVLGYLAKQVKGLQDQAAAGAEQAEQAKLATIQEAITKLRNDAELLKSITIGVDEAGAIASVDTIRELIQEKLKKNPVILPVVTVASGSDAAKDNRIGEILGEAPKKATGGKLRGPGTGTSDSILMWGSNGEWMIRQRAAQYYGDGFMRAVNNMELPRYAMGGAIGDSAARATSSLSGAVQDRAMQPAFFNIPGVGQVPVQIERSTGQSLEKQLRREALKAGRR